MPVREILTYPNPILRMPTEEITIFDDELKTLVDDMLTTMLISDGVGLSGPQIGVSKKIFVAKYNGEDYVLINPFIYRKQGTVIKEEGCLSFPGEYYQVESPRLIKIKYQDINGKYFNERIDGHLACVYSHEVDHLNGRLLIDRIIPIGD